MSGTVVRAKLGPALAASVLTWKGWRERTSQPLRTGPGVCKIFARTVRYRAVQAAINHPLHQAVLSGTDR
jgi:hypothetical protein